MSNTTPDNTTWTLNAYSIGMIEPVSPAPCKGTAP